MKEEEEEEEDLDDR